MENNSSSLQKRTIFTFWYILALGFIAILRYYGGELFQVHSEKATGAFWFFASIFVPFFIYEITLLISGKKERNLSIIGCVGIFLYVLFASSIATFSGVSWGGGGGFALFFQIIKFSLLPLFILFVTTASGRTLLKKIPDFSIDNNVFHLVSIGLGLMLFISIHAIFGFFGLFSIWTSLGILWLFLAISLPEAKELFLTLIKGRWTYSLSNNVFSEKLFVIIGEFFLLTLFVLVSINLTNIVRPFPIGWDDLGVYMNYPKLMAMAGDVRGYGMVLWQTFTAIGFLGGSTTQAFFLNELGSLLAILSIIFGLKSLLPKQEYSLPLPLIAATIFMAMPMIIFQQAKDMKIDPALFGMSVTAIIALLHGLKTTKLRHKCILFAIAGIMAGWAFAMKFTTLMLLVAGVATIWYSSIGLAGFFAFASLFVATFSGLKLWNFMNVITSNNHQAVLIASGALAVLGIIILVLWIWKKEKKYLLNTLVLPTIIFIMSAGGMLSPWILKNISEAHFQDISVGTILNGRFIGFVPEYTKFLSPEELKKRQDAESAAFLNTDGNTVNEDLGRYFGYEEGINNYLKLPYNLTLQKNQWGEFTDITYLYLALIPGAFLLLSIGRLWTLVGMGIFLGSLFIYYISPDIGKTLTNLFGNIKLPIGYSVIFGIGILPFLFMHFAKPKEADTSHEHNLSTFVITYSLLFGVAAFGIVWYGISMYFAFLALIVLAFADFLGRDIDEDIKLLWSTVFLLLTLPFFVLSALPHAWNNLPKDNLDFKIGQVTQNEATFTSRPEYLKVLSNFNLNDESKMVRSIIENISNTELKTYFTSIDHALSAASFVNELKTFEQGASNPKTKAIADAARDARMKVYDAILFPDIDQKNSGKIYRIGTFLTFYISENRARYLEDSLITTLDRYVQGKNRDETIENMKKLGIKYLLIDLNAATIDRDPRHDLTRRYELLLDLMKSNKLKLIETDSLCLKMALEDKNNQNFTYLAGVNYPSYVKMDDGQDGIITQDKKTALCKSTIANILFSGKITENSYSFLLPTLEQVRSANIQTPEDLMTKIQNLPRGWMAAFEIQ